MCRFFNFILFVVFLSGCGEYFTDGRKDELCRLLLEPGLKQESCDSIVELAKKLPADERLDVLLEAIRGKHKNNALQSTSWIQEAERIAPKRRRVEVEMEKLRKNYVVAYTKKDTAALGWIEKAFSDLKKDYRFTDRQKIYFLCNKVVFNRDSSLLESWMDMTEALRLVRWERDPLLTVRVLESFSEIALKGGDPARAINLRKEAYRIRVKEGLFPSRREFLNWMLDYWAYSGGKAELLKCLKELREEVRMDAVREKPILRKMAEMYCEVDSLDEALRVLREASGMEGTCFYHADLAGKFANVFEKQGKMDSAKFHYERSVEGWQGMVKGKIPPGAIPAYSSYARVLWKEGQPERALDLLKMAVANVPVFGRSAPRAGDIYLLPYLEALLQLGEYNYEIGDFRSASELLLRRDSFRDRYEVSNDWYKKLQLAERYRNQELKVKLALQEELLASRRRGVVMMALVCVFLVGCLLLLWKLYYQKQRRLDDIYRKQKEVERLEYQVMAERPQVSSEAILFSRLEKIVLEELLFQKPDLSLEDLCPLVGSNRSYVSACVNKEAGMNLSSWLNKIRISYVLKEIKNGKDDLTELYVNAGFASSTSFYRNFKLQIQMTPKQYIEREGRKAIEE